jgi:acetylornithine deacetylase/succinyl-diaminopimelate desuccinylase-like protein
MRSFHRIALVMVSVCALAGADRNILDWRRLAAETQEHYTALIRINTTNPPGNETRAANYLKQVLDREGIPSKLYAMEPDRANLVARLKGTGKKRPLLLLAHTDVVGVQKERWSVDPFAAVRKDGYVYGRGAIDDKDKLAANLMVFLQLKRSRLKLDRDVIFLAEAGEESSTHVGIDYMVREHWPEIEAEFAVTEGGGGVSRNGVVRYLTISTTEKVPRRMRLVAHGTAGHGSIPRPDNAVVRLANAVTRLAAWQPQMRLNDTTRTYFERLATISTPTEAERYNHLTDPARTVEIQKYFTEREFQHNSLLRTSVVPTMLNAGFKVNVIPSEGEAQLDIRALPDENMDRFLEQMRRVISDPNVDIVPEKGGRPVGPPSRMDTEMFRAFETAQRRLYPGAITLPTMLTGATDMAQLRARGVQAYGIGPVIEEKDRDANGAHSDDERLAEGAVTKLAEFLWYAVTEVCAAKN